MRNEQNDRGPCETIKSRPSKTQDGLMSPLSGDGRWPANAEVSVEGYSLGRNDAFKRTKAARAASPREVRMVWRWEMKLPCR